MSVPTRLSFALSVRTALVTGAGGGLDRKMFAAGFVPPAENGLWPEGILVNNAGFMTAGKIGETTIEDRTGHAYAGRLEAEVPNPDVWSRRPGEVVRDGQQRMVPLLERIETAQ